MGWGCGDDPGRGNSRSVLGRMVEDKVQKVMAAGHAGNMAL